MKMQLGKVKKANKVNTQEARRSIWKIPPIRGSKKADDKMSLMLIQTADSESYLVLMRNLVKSTGIYTISSLASPLVLLLLLPFLTSTLSHNDYGALAILDTVIALVASVTTLGMDAVFARVYSYECNTHREQLDALSTLTLLLLLIMVPFLIIGVMAAQKLSILLLGSAVYSNAITITVWLVLLQNMTLPGLMWMRVEDRAALYSIFSVANLVLVAGATIVLVGGLHMGLAGALIAMGLGNVIVAISTLPFVFFHAGFRLRSTIAISMLKLGIPYAMNYITLWILLLSDRYLLGHFVSISTTASYTIAYSVGGGVGLLIAKPFSLAWWVLIYPIARRGDALFVFKIIFRWYSFILFFATLGLSLFGGSILDLLFPASYHGQSLLISVIALSTVFISIFAVFNLGMNLQRKTWLAFISLLCSAVLNVGLNVVLIPLYGAMGAAIATLVGYVALALVSYLFNQRIYPVPFEIGLFFIAMGIGILFYIADSKLTQEQSNVTAWSIHITLLLLYGGILAWLGFKTWPGKRRRIYHNEDRISR